MGWQRGPHLRQLLLAKCEELLKRKYRAARMIRSRRIVTDCVVERIEFLIDGIGIPIAAPPLAGTVSRESAAFSSQVDMKPELVVHEGTHTAVVRIWIRSLEEPTGNNQPFTLERVLEISAVGHVD